MSIGCGVDVGGTKILAVAVDRSSGVIVAEDRTATPRGGDAIVAAVADLLKPLLSLDGAPASAGAGIPGLIDPSGRLRMGANLPGVLEYPFAEALSAAVGVPVVVDNDANCAALGEARVGAAAGASEVVLVTLGTGIGTGLISGGVVQRGAHGFAGEAGHMVIDPKGPVCPCGKRGCWERFASGSGLGRLARDAAEAGRLPAVVELAGGDPEAVRGEHVSQLVEAGDPHALALLEEFAWWVALGLANLVDLLDPALIVVGGGLVRTGDALLDPVRRAFEDLVLAGRHRPPVPIVQAKLGERAGAIGAALLD